MKSQPRLRLAMFLGIASVCTLISSCGPSDGPVDDAETGDEAQLQDGGPNVVPETATPTDSTAPTETAAMQAACTAIKGLKVDKQSARWYSLAGQRYAELRLEVTNPNAFDVLLEPTSPGADAVFVVQNGGPFGSGPMPPVLIPASATGHVLVPAVKMTASPGAGGTYTIELKTRIVCSSGGVTTQFNRAAVPIPDPLITITVDDPSGAPGHILKRGLPLGHGAEDIPGANYTLMRVSGMTPLATIGGTPGLNQCHSGLSNNIPTDRWFNMAVANSQTAATLEPYGQLVPNSNPVQSYLAATGVRVFGWQASVGCYYVRVDVPSLLNHNLTAETHYSPIIGVIMNPSSPGNLVAIDDLHLCITREWNGTTTLPPTVEWKACPAYSPPTNTPIPVNSCLNVIQTPTPPFIQGPNPAVAGMLRIAGVPQSGVTVDLENCTAPAGGRSVVTLSGGLFSFNDLPNGFYRLTVSPLLIPVPGQMNPTVPFLVEATGGPFVITKDLSFQ